MESTIKLKQGQVGDLPYIEDTYPNLKKLLFRDYVSATVTGGTSETVCKSYLIPANTLDTTKLLRLNYSALRDTAIGISTFKIRVSPTPTVAGVIIHSFISTNTLRWFCDFSSFLHRAGFLESRSGTASTHDATQQTTAVSLSAFDPTVDNYIVFTITNASASEVTKMNWIEIIN